MVGVGGGGSPIFPWETDPRRFVNLVDDFHFGTGEDGEVGDLGWRLANISGNNGTITKPEPSPGTGNVYGSVGIQGGVGAGAGAYGIYSGGEWYRSATGLPVGATMYARIFAPSAAGQVIWVGLANQHATPAVAAGTAFIGFRHEAGVDGNVYGVVKDGATGANEDVASLGALDTTNWATYAVHRTATSVFVFSTGSTFATVTTTNLDVASTMEWVVGCDATGAADKAIHVDFFGVNFPLDRG